MAYPSAWERYCGAVGHVDPRQYGLKATNDDINRWAARYRAARAFGGVLLEGYSNSTSEGYSGFCKVFFVWSAFERFLPIVGLEQVSSGRLFKNEDSESIGRRVLELDRNERLYGFIYDRCNNKNQEELQKWRSKELGNFTYLLSAVRHVFVHGHLTPHADGANPVKSAKICNIISDHVLDVMDNEFTRLIDSFHGLNALDIKKH
jgi:hypothetical protein